MNYEEFCTHVKERVQEIMGEETKVTLKTNLKNNGMELIGLLIFKEKENMIPTLYLEEFYKMYECGTCFEEVLEKILSIYEESKWEGDLDISFFFDYERVEKQIVYRLIHQKGNEKLLEKMPWFPVLDLAMVFYCRLPDEVGVKANIPIEKEHLERWGKTKLEIQAAAIKNMPQLLPRTIEPIGLVMERILEETAEEMDDELFEELHASLLELRKQKEIMYVLSNTERYCGSASLLYPEVLRNFAEEVGEDLYILPSSIHEVLLIPDDGGFEKNELEGLVSEVNLTQLAIDEKLSDSVYYYKRETGKITIL